MSLCSQLDDCLGPEACQGERGRRRGREKSLHCSGSHRKQVQINVYICTLRKLYIIITFLYVPYFNWIWPTAVAGKADGVSSVSASACHIRRWAKLCLVYGYYIAGRLNSFFVSLTFSTLLLLYYIWRNTNGNESGGGGLSLIRRPHSTGDSSSSLNRGGGRVLEKTHSGGSIASAASRFVWIRSGH